MSISKKEIKHIASLAKLNINTTEEDKYVKEFNDILGYIEQINKVNTDGLNDSHHLQEYDISVLKDDKVRTSKISKEKMLKNSSNNRLRNGYIRVSKIINK